MSVVGQHCVGPAEVQGARGLGARALALCAAQLPPSGSEQFVCGCLFSLLRSCQLARFVQVDLAVKSMIT